MSLQRILFSKMCKTKYCKEIYEGKLINFIEIYNIRSKKSAI